MICLKCGEEMDKVKDKDKFVCVKDGIVIEKGA